MEGLVVNMSEKEADCLGMLWLSFGSCKLQLLYHRFAACAHL